MNIRSAWGIFNIYDELYRRGQRCTDNVSEMNIQSVWIFNL